MTESVESVRARTILTAALSSLSLCTLETTQRQINQICVALGARPGYEKRARVASATALR